VGGRDKPGHDGGGAFAVMRGRSASKTRVDALVSRASTSGRKQDVGGRDKPGHDGGGKFAVMRGPVPRIHVSEKKARRGWPGDAQLASAAGRVWPCTGALL